MIGWIILALIILGILGGIGYAIYWGVERVKKGASSILPSLPTKLPNLIPSTGCAKCGYADDATEQQSTTLRQP